MTTPSDIEYQVEIANSTSDGRNSEKSQEFLALCKAFCAGDGHSKVVQEVEMSNQVVECVCLNSL